MGLPSASRRSHGSADGEELACLPGPGGGLGGLRSSAGAGALHAEVIALDRDRFVGQSEGITAFAHQTQDNIMKTQVRIGAGLSFTFFLLSGVCLLAATGFGMSGESLVLTALGLFLVGTAFFAGPLLWLAAENWCSRQAGK